MAPHAGEVQTSVEQLSQHAAAQSTFSRCHRRGSLSCAFTEVPSSHVFGCALRKVLLAATEEREERHRDIWTVLHHCAWSCPEDLLKQRAACVEERKSSVLHRLGGGCLEEGPCRAAREARANV